jgi:hypothetical protein
VCRVDRVENGRRIRDRSKIGVTDDVNKPRSTYPSIDHGELLLRKEGSSYSQGYELRGAMEKVGTTQRVVGNPRGRQLPVLLVISILQLV